MNKNSLKLIFLGLFSLIIIGCGGSHGGHVDETKPIAEVKAEAQEMSVKELEHIIKDFEKQITVKTGQLEQLAAKVKEIPVTELLGEEAKALKEDVSTLKSSVDALTARLKVYTQQLEKLAQES